MNNFVVKVVVLFVIVVHVLVKTGHADGQSDLVHPSETNITKARAVRKGGKVTLQSWNWLYILYCRGLCMLWGNLFYQFFFLQVASLQLMPCRRQAICFAHETFPTHPPNKLCLLSKIAVPILYFRFVAEDLMLLPGLLFA